MNYASTMDLSTQCCPPLNGDFHRDQDYGMEVLAKKTLPAALTKKNELMKDFMAMAMNDTPSYSK